MRKNLIFVFNFNPKQSFTDYGFLVPAGTYEVILNTDNPDYGGNGLTDDTIKHFTIHDPLYKKRQEGVAEALHTGTYSCCTEKN